MKSDKYLASNYKYHQGFTLIELLVVLVVLGIIVAFSIPSFTSYTQSQYLRQAAEQVLSDLRSAQTRAQNGVVSGSNYCWGLALTNGSTSYSDCSFPCGTTTCTSQSTTILPQSVTVSSGGTVIFSKLTGLPGSAINITLSRGSNTKTVVVETGGNMYVQ